MPGPLTTGLFVIAAATLAVTMIGEHRLHRVDWSRLGSHRIRWSQPETKLLMVTLAAAVGAFTAMAGAFTSYRFDLHAMARLSADATETARKLIFTRAYTASGAAVFCYGGWRMWRTLRRNVRIERTR